MRKRLLTFTFLGGRDARPVPAVSSCANRFALHNILMSKTPTRTQTTRVMTTNFDADLTAKIVAAYGPARGTDYAAAVLAAYAQRTGHTRQAIEAELVARKLVARVSASRVAATLWDLFTSTSAR